MRSHIFFTIECFSLILKCYTNVLLPDVVLCSMVMVQEHKPGSKQSLPVHRLAVSASPICPPAGPHGGQQSCSAGRCGGGGLSWGGLDANGG